MFEVKHNNMVIHHDCKICRITKMPCKTAKRIIDWYYEHNGVIVHSPYETEKPWLEFKSMDKKKNENLD